MFNNQDITIERLNRLPEIKSIAIFALKSRGWQQHEDGIHFTVPKKKIETKKYSAIFDNYPKSSDIPLFTVFVNDSRAFPFSRKQGYKPMDIMFQYYCVEDHDYYSEDNYGVFVDKLVAEYLND